MQNEEAPSVPTSLKIVASKEEKTELFLLPRHDREMRALRCLFYAKRALEQGANMLAQAARDLNRPLPKNAIKLMQRGWDRVDEGLGRFVSEDAYAEFAMIMAEEERRQYAAEEEGRGGPDGDEGAGDGGGEDGYECAPAGVGAVGPDPEPGEGSGGDADQGCDGGGQ